MGKKNKKKRIFFPLWFEIPAKEIFFFLFYFVCLLSMRMWLLKNEGKMVASECTSLYLAFHLSYCINFCQLTLNFSFLLSVLSMLSTWKSSGVLQLEIVCVDSTKAWARTPIVWPIWIRTCQTIWSTRWPSSPYPRNGCGARLGAVQKNWLEQRRLILWVHSLIHTT